MLIITETVIIISYMLNGYLGAGIMLTIVLHRCFSKKESNSLIRILDLLIMSLPIAYIGFAGITMHQMLSWYNFFLIIFLVEMMMCFSFRIFSDATVTCVLFLALLCIIINLFWTNYVIDSIIEIVQLLVMIMPLVIVHGNREKIPVTKEDAYCLLSKYVDVCVATAMSMLFQYAMYRFRHRVIGIIHYSGGSRVQFYCLFKGASILPIYMGIGIIFLFITCFEKKISIQTMIKIILIFGATALNTSRTALFALIVTLIIITIKYLIKTPSFRGIILAILGFAAISIAINYILNIRSGLTGFLDVNNRNITWNNGIQIWMANFKNFFIGEGFAGGRWIGIVKPHNFIIQTLAQCGLIVTIILLIILIKYLFDNKKNVYIFIPIYVILACMLVTDFYANAFTTVIFIIIDLYGGALPEKMGNYNISVR